MNLSSELTEIKGVGDALAKKFATLGIRTIADLFDYYPRRYEDYSKVSEISKLQPGPVTIQALIKQVSGRYVRRGLHITEAIASDSSGSVRLIWFNQPYRAASLKKDQQYFISGVFELSRHKFSLINPSVELVSDFPTNTARILAVYRETKGLTSRQIRMTILQTRDLFAQMPESMPEHIIKKHRLISAGVALSRLHMPSTPEELDSAKRRIGFEEVFQLSLASLLNKQKTLSSHALKISFNETLARSFVKALPFKLTDDQRRTIWQIYLDMQNKWPMNRMVEGDVGSGKTVIAAMAAVMPMADGLQVALMAPTELLARQHAETIHGLLTPLGLANKVALLVGSMSSAQKSKVRSEVKSGRASFVIGTHALIQDQVDMHNLGLVMIDEQHRFGVEQRKELMKKAGHMPHMLSLTATPIPRSLALTLYGELDISVIRQKPADRLPVLTEIISPNSREQVYAKIRTEIARGNQVFVVCPLISESEQLPVRSAEQVYEEMRNQIFPDSNVGLLHGKQQSQSKQNVMMQFVAGELDVLVSTTVIEVGVDVPNATVMMIESAERFGLAQLHQLRGRVGRSDKQGHCYLMLDDSRPASRRLRALQSSNDGFKLAELDLEIRGPGAIYGSVQHGQLDLRVAKLTDTKLIAEARSAAQELLDSGQDLLQYNQLMQHINQLRKVTNLN